MNESGPDVLALSMKEIEQIAQLFFWIRRIKHFKEQEKQIEVAHSKPVNANYQKINQSIIVSRTDTT